MLYLHDFLFRIIYLILASFFCGVYIYMFLDEFIFILMLPTLMKTYFLESFIFTEPKEIFFFKIYTFLFFLVLVVIPYCIFLILDYFKTGFYQIEWNNFKKVQNRFLIIYLISNFITFFYFIPVFWRFFYVISSTSTLNYYFFELSALNYFHFIYSLFLLTNLSLFLFFALSLVINRFKLTRMLRLKPYLILSFLIFSTLVTPPDLEIQILLFLSLYICMELIFYFLFVIGSYLQMFFIKKVTN